MVLFVACLDASASALQPSRVDLEVAEVPYAAYEEPWDWAVPLESSPLTVELRTVMDLSYVIPPNVRLQIDGAAVSVVYNEEFESGTLEYRLLSDEIDDPDLFIFGRTLEGWSDYFEETLSVAGALAGSQQFDEIDDYLQERRVFELFRDTLLLLESFALDQFPSTTVGNVTASAGTISVDADGEAREIFCVHTEGDEYVVFYAPLWIKAATSQNLTQRYRLERVDGPPLGGVVPYGDRVQDWEILSGERIVTHTALGVEGPWWFAGVLESRFQQVSRAFSLRTRLSAVPEPLSASGAVEYVEDTTANDYRQTDYVGGVKFVRNRLEIMLGVGLGRGEGVSERRATLAEASFATDLNTTFSGEADDVSGRSESSYRQDLSLLRAQLSYTGFRWGLNLLSSADTGSWNWHRSQLYTYLPTGRDWWVGLGGASLIENEGERTAIANLEALEPDFSGRYFEGRLQFILGRTDGAPFRWPFMFRSNPLLPEVQDWLDIRIPPPGIYLINDWESDKRFFPRLLVAGERTRLLLGGWWESSQEFAWEAEVVYRGFEVRARQEEVGRTNLTRDFEFEFGWRLRENSFFGLAIDNFTETDARFSLLYVGNIRGFAEFLQSLAFWRRIRPRPQPTLMELLP